MDRDKSSMTIYQYFGDMCRRAMLYSDGKKNMNYCRSYSKWLEHWDKEELDWAEEFGFIVCIGWSNFANGLMYCLSKSGVRWADWYVGGFCYWLRKRLGF